MDYTKKQLIMNEKTLMGMTAYAEASQAFDWGQATWQLKSVNHRYLDLNCYLPESLLSVESDIKALIQSLGVHRGKVTLNLQYQLTDQASVTLRVNEPLLEQVSSVTRQLQNVFPHASVDVFNAMNYKGLISYDKVDMSVYKDDLMALLTTAVEGFLQARQREGAAVQSFFEQRLSDVKALCQVIEEQYPAVIAHNKTRIMDKLSEMGVKWEAERVEQELFWFAQKIDIAEELQRLQAHWVEFHRFIQAGGVVGRRLDFLMQELNREANTVASKSVDVKVTQAAVDIKVALEQMREQVQNVE